MAGVSRLQFSTEIKIIRVMCTGRVDLSFIFRAFLNRADGVIIAGCWPGECHYVTEGNLDALGNIFLAKKLLEHIGVNPDRLRLEWVAASEGIRYAEVMDSFAKQVRELGPFGQAEGIDDNALKLRLEAANQLIPYMKLVERERLRAPVKTKDAYHEFYSSEEVNRLFKELITDKLTISQIMLLLKESPLSTGKISELLHLSPSEVAKYMNTSSRQGLVRYDVASNCYARA